MTANLPLTPDYTGIPSGGFIASPQPSPAGQQHLQPQYPPQFQQYPPQQQQYQQQQFEQYSPNPFQQGQPPPQTQQLAPYAPGPPLPVQNQQQLSPYGPATMQNVHPTFQDTEALIVPQRPRMGSNASTRSHRSTHSHHSGHSRHSSQSHHSERSYHSSRSRSHQDLRELEKRPSWGDSVYVMFNAVKGAFDKRKA